MTREAVARCPWKLGSDGNKRTAGWSIHSAVVPDKAREKERDGDYCQLLVTSERTGARIDAAVHFRPPIANALIGCLSPDTSIVLGVLYDFSDANQQPGNLVDRGIVVANERDPGVAADQGKIALINFGWMQRHCRPAIITNWLDKKATGIADNVVTIFKERCGHAIGCDTVACDVAAVDAQGMATPGHTTQRLPQPQSDYRYAHSSRQAFAALSLQRDAAENSQRLRRADSSFGFL